MPKTAKNYSITELEMHGLAINIATFSHQLIRVDCDAVIDHLAIMHIMKSKMEPATNRIKRLLEVLSSYSFNLYYIKGKDMVLNDYFSRQMGDESNPHQVIPISLNIKEVSLKPCQDKTRDMFLVQTRSHTKGVKSTARGKSTDSTCKKVQDMKPIIIEDDDDQDISNQMKTKSSTIGDTKSSIKHPSNQICPHPTRPPDPLDQITRLQQELNQILILRKIAPLRKA